MRRKVFVGLTTDLHVFSSKFKIRIQKVGIAIDPKGWSGLSYRRRSDQPRPTSDSCRFEKKSDLSKQKNKSTALDWRFGWERCFATEM
ncbi:MAG: hypothetical protein NTY15_13415 [Planctomycetota bacterium]|jgi:hypothetical protein|nr:hypothetical protein [Planctomycetota bacterium]